MNSSTTRSARIDFLRGIAIFSVLLLHFSLTYTLAASPLTRIFPTSWIRAAINNGNYGVTMFFVISGFLITSNNLLRYKDLGAVNLRQFYLFRFARIVPPLLVALAIIVPLGLLDLPSFTNSSHGELLPHSYFFIATLSVLTFWHNVLMQSAGYFNYCLNIYWSLSVEEVFYLTFPIACVLLKRRQFVVLLCLAAIAIAPFYRNAHKDDEIFYMYAYPACFDAIAFGCLGALFYDRLRLRRRPAFIVRSLAAVLLAVTYFSGIDGHESLGFSLVALSMVGLLVNAFDIERARPRSWAGRLVCWFGQHSYELYLFHIIVLAATRELIPKTALGEEYKLPLFAAFLALSALAAWVVAKYLADPLNARLRKVLTR